MGIVEQELIEPVCWQDPAKYTDEQVDHMRRVVSYCARHLAQEEKMKDTKTEEELEKTKSTKSLKNWVSMRRNLVARDESYRDCHARVTILSRRCINPPTMLPNRMKRRTPARARLPKAMERERVKGKPQRSRSQKRKIKAMTRAARSTTGPRIDPSESELER